jgi:hypothetical protein
VYERVRECVCICVDSWFLCVKWFSVCHHNPYLHHTKCEVRRRWSWEKGWGIQTHTNTTVKDL